MSPSHPSSSAYDADFTEERSDRLQSLDPTPCLSAFPPLSVTYQQHLMNQVDPRPHFLKTLPSSGFQDSHSLSWFFCHITSCQPLCCLCRSVLRASLIAVAPGINPLTSYLSFTNTCFQSELFCLRSFIDHLSSNN